MYSETLSTLSMKVDCADRQTRQAHIMSRHHDLSSLPVIDFSKLNEQSGVRSLAIKDIGKACKTFGCFQVRKATLWFIFCSSDVMGSKLDSDVT